MSPKRLFVKSKKKEEVLKKRKIFAFLSWGAVTFNGEGREMYSPFIDSPGAKMEGKI